MLLKEAPPFVNFSVSNVEQDTLSVGSLVYPHSLDKFCRQEGTLLWAFHWQSTLKMKEENNNRLYRQNTEQEILADSRI